jgi:hypothetical protein
MSAIPSNRAQFCTAACGLLPLLALYPSVGAAQLSFHGRADTKYEYNSNIFALPSSAPTPRGRGDSELSVEGGLTATYLLSRQSLNVEANATRSMYETYKELNHTEYAFRAGLDWVLARAFSGTVNVSRRQSMVQFQDTTAATRLLLETQWQGDGSIHWQLRPDWRIEATALARKDDSPRPNAPNNTLRENSEDIALKYAGLLGSTLGLRGEYRTGDFDQAIAGPSTRYHQKTVEFTALRSDKRSTFTAAFGYTWRDENVSSSRHLAAPTGALSYERQLTGKTKLDLKLVRVVTTYINSAGAELDLDASAGVVWQATGKTGVELTYLWTRSEISGQQPGLLGQQPGGLTAQDRTDQYQVARAAVVYRPYRWLAVRPYAEFQHRSSTINLYSFSADLVGIKFDAKF